MSGPSSTRREAVSGGVPLTRREAAVLDIIREVARVHRPCPPNAAFAARISSPDVPGISHVMRSLQAKGAITVVARGPLPRVITLLDGSGATYDPRAGTEPSAAGPTPASLKAGTAASNPGAAAADDAADEGDESDAGADEIPLDRAPMPTNAAARFSVIPIAVRTISAATTAARRRPSPAGFASGSPPRLPSRPTRGTSTHDPRERRGHDRPAPRGQPCGPELRGRTDGRTRDRAARGRGRDATAPARPGPRPQAAANELAQGPAPNHRVLQHRGRARDIEARLQHSS